jgi:sugar lactone lactonase YvrE
VGSADGYGSRISHYDSDGTLECQISVPAKQCSSLIFGGPKLQDIFFTSAAKSEPMPVMPCHAMRIRSGHCYFGGVLFQLNAGIQRRPEYDTRFRVPDDSIAG